MKFSRGAALPETVVVLGLSLTLLYGTFELGLIGYTQLSADGAAFVAAHAAVLGNDPSAAIASPFPMANGAKVTLTQNPPEDTNVPVDYQSSQAQQNNRHGGVQVVRPSRTQVTIGQTGGIGGGVLGQFDVAGAFIEGNMLVSDTGFDLNGYAINDPTAKMNGYFADDGNAPPYFIGFRYMWHCDLPVQNNGCGHSVMAALGMAEYLNGGNWNQPANGIGPGAVYAAMLLHQQVYANILNNGELPQSVGGGNRPITWTTPCLQTVAAWDVDVPAGYPIGQKAIGFYPFSPLYRNPAC
ncbi:MAG: hypothetical protein QOI11_705 [Candidatus Eremiobacteraeota bacterium]|nr:hypothetical protein [Candidatus Eremiobacteraeota bacterium]